ncbi:four-disulfide core domain 5 [Podarcis lilfordi]|uniref:Four-disulfide core domain 5 n=1 Tax=Podarcis lilfordi TaxID=74358 RepID=A0AA35PB14_9SAUR|nr:four-disulfide core domain 5 [Podarcis lilfordi]
MKARSILALVGLLALWTQLSPASCMPPLEKFGTCPPNPFKCSVKGQDACNHDYDCEGIQKCCYFNCGKICRNPQEKAGSCPILPYFCSVPEGDLCSSDYDCPEKKKCCYVNCGKSCVDP